MKQCRRYKHDFDCVRFTPREAGDRYFASFHALLPDEDALIS